jgi:integrase
VQGSIGGETVRRSLNTGNWTAASSLVHQWQWSGRIGVLKPDLPTVTEAVEQFLTEARVRNLAATTIQKRRELLEGKLLPFCAHRGHRQLRDLTVERLREFRRTWTYSPLSAAKRLEYLRAFLRFCVEAGWIERNPAAALKPTKVPHKPTLPYPDAEVERLLEAARALVGFGQYGPRIEPMILLLRYSGLRMQDAACLERARLDGDKLFLVELPPASLPRHVRRLAPAEGGLARQRVEVARPQFDQDHRTALCTLGEGAPGSARERSSSHLALTRSRSCRVRQSDLADRAATSWPRRDELESHESADSREVALVLGDEHAAGFSAGEGQQDVVAERLRHATEVGPLVARHRREHVA